MMRMPVALGAGKAGNKNIWAEGANDAHHVGKWDIFAAPVLKCFLGSLRKTEVGDTREALLDSVVTIRSQKLQRADDAKFVEESGAKFVLSAFAASQRHENGLDSVAARLQREYAAIFVVGMGGNHHQTSGILQSAKCLLEARCARVLWERVKVRLLFCWRRLSLRNRESAEKEGSQEGGFDFCRPDFRFRCLHMFYETAICGLRNQNLWVARFLSPPHEAWLLMRQLSHGLCRGLYSCATIAPLRGSHPGLYSCATSWLMPVEFYACTIPNSIVAMGVGPICDLQSS